MISEKLVFFKPLTESESVVIRNEVDPTAVCKTDQQLLGIIVHNIISNAFKFTIKGSVCISSSETNEHTVLKIEDTGIGMNEEKLAQVQQAIQSPAGENISKIAGKGMGLILIHDLARILRIRIDYASQEEIGTTVTLYIPKTVIK